MMALYPQAISWTQKAGPCIPGVIREDRSFIEATLVWRYQSANALLQFLISILDPPL